eukprot:3033966-Rhodomonas_salina.1
MHPTPVPVPALVSSYPVPVRALLERNNQAPSFGFGVFRFVFGFGGLGLSGSDLETAADGNAA